MRKILSRFFRQLFYSIKDFSKSADFRRWMYIAIVASRHNRHQTLTFKLASNSILAADSASLVSMAEEIYADCAYDFECQRKDPIILDIGANIGLATLRWAQKFPQAQITAIEADPNIFKILMRNIEMAGFKSRVKLICGAAWTCDGSLSFLSDGADGGKIINPNSVTNQQQDPPKIPSLDLKKILSPLPYIDLLKIDIEGAEHFVLPHISELLNKVDRLFIEVHEGSKANLGGLLKILEENGFQYYLSPVSQIKSPFLNFEKTKNSIFSNQINVWAKR